MAHAFALLRLCTIDEDDNAHSFSLRKEEVGECNGMRGAIVNSNHFKKKIIQPPQKISTAFFKRGVGGKGDIEMMPCHLQQLEISRKRVSFFELKNKQPLLP